MYLSRVEMTGFKSFADKTVIEFNEGMTAVVGPNGSGKSNLSEAIRWVLGEQSAKSLRGNRMEDVIFNGTQARKPVNIAKVTLVLNNEDRYLDYDFSEISITRSYNRNGDSQYLINNEQVRLRDIVDLLLDSGLGKNSFSIISQGQVEQIFLSKPEERRTIFEEAAGVQKYQYRKTEAERRLDKSSDNLSRVKDIIHELELQLNPLRKQRETALLYTSKKEELKELEVSLYTQQIEDYQTGWEELEEQLKNIDVTLNNLITQNETLSNEIDASKNKQNQLINAIDQNSDTYQKLTSQIEKLRAQQQMIEKDIQYSETEQADKANIYEEQVAEKTRLDQDIMEYTKQLQTFEADLKALMAELKEVNKDIQISQGLNANQQDELRNEMLEYYQLEAKSNNEIQQQKAVLERQRARKDQAAEKMNSTSQELKKLEVEAIEAEEELEAFTGSQSEQRTLLQELTENNEKLSNQRDELRQLLFNQERQTQTIETRLNSLKQMHDNYTGYYAGVRAVMQQAQRLNGIEGTVADLLNVKETYQLAIDTALGGSMQHIVVANDQAAREAVNYLKQQRAGRATFLPRPNIKPRQIQSFKLFQAQEMQGFIAVASELVSYDAKNENIVQNLLGNTIVAQTLVDAQSIARALGHSVKIVTLEGDVLMPGGSLTGGQQKQRQQSMLSRQNEIKQASEAYEKHREQLKNIELDWEKVSKELANNEQQLKEQRQQVNQTEGIYQRLFQSSQNAKQAYKQANNQMIILKDSIREFDEELDEARNTIELAERNLVKAKSSIEELNRILEQHNLDEDARQKKLAELEEFRQDKSTKKAVMDVEIKQLKQTLSDLKNQYEVVNNWITNYESSKTFGLSSIEELQEKLEETLDDIAKLEKESESLQKQIQADRQNRQDLSETINEKESLLNKSQAESQRSFQTQAKLQAQIEKNQALIDNHLNHLNQEYQLTFEMAKKIAKPIESTAETNKVVKELRQFINKLGPINLQAIEDYDELNERYELLVEQEEDLLTAMGQLKDTMDEMDVEVTRRFSATFKLINEKFQQTFRRLFGGGEASLELTNPKDVLTTGVDIVAQPPGKKKQNLALLSGGERALTAIALLFAILEVKPVPFVILDEVEAALDDANVYRYGEYIKEFREQTQFIVITHRKGTMESADRLYGVTMERSGISKLASVKLSEAEEALSE